MIKSRHVRWIAAIAALCAAGAACKKDEVTKAPSSTTPPSAAAPAPVSTVMLQTTLAAADAHDGTTDKTVSECAMCGLRMKGVADHASTHSGYTLHFCSAACKGHFDEDATKAIAALTVPGNEALGGTNESRHDAGATAL